MSDSISGVVGWLGCVKVPGLLSFYLIPHLFLYKRSVSICVYLWLISPALGIRPSVVIVTEYPALGVRSSVHGSNRLSPLVYRLSSFVSHLFKKNELNLCLFIFWLDPCRGDPERFSLAFPGDVFQGPGAAFLTGHAEFVLGLIESAGPAFEFIHQI